jgi:hypothetical protein
MKALSVATVARDGNCLLKILLQFIVSEIIQNNARLLTNITEDYKGENGVHGGNVEITANH